MTGTLCEVPAEGFWASMEILAGGLDRISAGETAIMIFLVIIIVLQFLFGVTNIRER